MWKGELLHIHIAEAAMAMRSDVKSYPFGAELA